ncbi:MAG: BTAD domain-containing putative transcriptional regulator [Geminicoccaceae bacterium]
MLALLWPDSGEARARASLRQVLFQTRRMLTGAGYDGLVTDRERIALEGNVVTDVEEIFREIRQGRPPRCLIGMRRPVERVLAGFTAPGESFASWLNLRRSEIEDRLRLALRLALEHAEGDARRDLAKCFVALDPSDETAVRAMMRVHVEMGDVGGALSAYERLWNLLAEEFDTEPSKVTRDLAVQIKLGHAATETVPPAAAEGDAPEPAAPPVRTVQAPYIRVVVGEFGNSTLPPESRAFVSLFRNELISCLNRFREWRVGDAGSGGEPAGDHAYVLGATARATGSRIRLDVALDNRDGTPVWAETTENLLQDWIEFPGKIAGRLSASLNINLSHARLAQLHAKAPVQTTTIDRWLLARQHVLSFTPAGWNRAIELTTAILDDEPDFVPAHISLSQLCNIRQVVFPGSAIDANDYIRAIRHADLAIAEDPLDARAHLCRGWALTMQRRFREAALSVTLAVEANPNDAWVIVASALALAFGGNGERAKSMAQRALGLGWTVLPRDWCYLATIHFLGGDYEACVRAAVAGRDAIGNVAAWQAAAHAHLGEEEQAARACERFHAYAVGVWAGEAPPTAETIDKWFLSAFPIAEARTLERLGSGLARARSLWRRAQD